ARPVSVGRGWLARGVRQAGTHSSGSGASPGGASSSTGAPNVPTPLDSCTKRDPRSHDAHAAMNDMIIDAVNAMTNPSLNGCEMRCGKNVFPVRCAALSGGSCDRTLGSPCGPGAPRSFSIGL